MDPATWRYGGNTPCLELIAPDGTQMILDCGTGLRMLGSRWGMQDGGRTPETHILVTHYHWDHIQGIPFFSPLYSEHNQFHFYSFRSKYLGRDSLKQVFETQMALPYFPVDMSAMNAKRKFQEVAGGDTFMIGENKITTRSLNHPQGCLGFRIEMSVGTVAYVTGVPLPVDAVSAVCPRRPRVIRPSRSWPGSAACPRPCPARRRCDTPAAAA